MATPSASDPIEPTEPTQNLTPEPAPNLIAEPVGADPAAVEPVSTESLSRETGANESATSEPTPTALDAPTSAPSETGAAAQPTVVFVTAPQPPKKRGARGIGAVVALLATALFAVAYALLVLLIALIAPQFGTAGALLFFSSVTYWLPIIIFALAYLLLIVIINRAGWWAHVFGGFLVAVVVWVGFVGAAIIAANAVGASANTVTDIVLQQLTNPLGFAAAIAAREVPVWVGGLVARRGRLARVRNDEARVAYEQKLTDHRATLGVNTAV
jgi:hypothetical protein